jgi:hypothetical protein
VGRGPALDDKEKAQLEQRFGCVKYTLGASIFYFFGDFIGTQKENDSNWQKLFAKFRKIFIQIYNKCYYDHKLFLAEFYTDSKFVEMGSKKCSRRKLKVTKLTKLCKF